VLGVSLRTGIRLIMLVLLLMAWLVVMVRSIGVKRVAVAMNSLARVEKLKLNQVD
jgi:hypothetical protein